MKETKNILFVAHHRFDRSPGQRYRFEQVFDYLESKGLKCTLANIISEDDEYALYKTNNIFKKIVVGLKSYRKRIIDLFNANKYDLIVIYREALPTRATFFEKFIAKKNIPIVFDFDDAIWVKDVSEVNRKISWLKDERKIERLIPLCNHITCGNKYLADYALKYNKNVTIIPSTVDTSLYKPLEKQKNGVVKIGWVGSHTTIKHFELITNVLKQLRKKYKELVDFIVVGDENYKNDELNIHGFFVGLFCFLIGFIFASSGDIFWNSVRRIKFITLILAVIFFSQRLLFFLIPYWEGDSTVYSLQVSNILTAFESVCWMLSFTGLASSFLNKKNREESFLR